ncbi:MAG: hemerythrin domain-containing protein [Acidimicrobiales bacterium]|nr:hemerythrin domain-containing protein [Acidimicrobiales bacterium]
MTNTDQPGRITGPLKTWYDLHEALDHEVTGIAEDAEALTLDRLDAFATRFWAFDRELRAHSEVEDGIMFPAIAERGGSIEADLGQEHRDEQLAVYAVGAALLAANATRAADALTELVGLTADMRDSLKAHLEHEEATALTQVDGLFSTDEQSALFRTIISSLPADPQLQPWVTSALSPDHLELRLRNIASAMPAPALAALMAQIHDGVDAATWSVVESRTPDLASLVDRPSAS